MSARYIVTVGGQGYLVASPEQAVELFGEYDQIAPEHPADAVPAKITRAQGKAALMQAGLWPDVEAFVASLPDEARSMAEIALNDTLEWERSSPFLNQCAAGMDLTQEQLDALFIAAAQIVF